MHSCHFNSTCTLRLRQCKAPARPPTALCGSLVLAKGYATLHGLAAASSSLLSHRHTCLLERRGFRQIKHNKTCRKKGEIMPNRYFKQGRKREASVCEPGSKTHLANVPFNQPTTGR